MFCHSSGLCFFVCFFSFFSLFFLFPVNCKRDILLLPSLSKNDTKKYPVIHPGANFLYYGWHAIAITLVSCIKRDSLLFRLSQWPSGTTQTKPTLHFMIPPKFSFLMPPPHQSRQHSTIPPSPRQTTRKICLLHQWLWCWSTVARVPGAEERCWQWGGDVGELVV